MRLLLMSAMVMGPVTAGWLDSIDLNAVLSQANSGSAAKSNPWDRYLGSLDLNKVGQHISKQTGLDDTMDAVQSWQRGIGISDRQVQAVGSATTGLLAGSGDAASLGFAAQGLVLDASLPDQIAAQLGASPGNTQNKDYTTLSRDLMAISRAGSLDAMVAKATTVATEDGSFDFLVANLANLAVQKDFDALVASVPSGTFNVLSDLKGNANLLGLKYNAEVEKILDTTSGVSRNLVGLWKNLVEIQFKGVASNMEGGLRHLTNAANGLQNARVVAGKVQLTHSIKSSILDSQRAFKVADKDLQENVNSNHEEVTKNQQRVRKVTKTLKAKEREFQTESGNMAALERQIAGQARMVEQAKREKAQASREQSKAQREYAKAKKDQEYWKKVCYGTSWIPFVNIGTCVKSLVEDGDLRSATSKKSNADKRYNSKLSDLNSMKSRKQNISEKLEVSRRRVRDAKTKVQAVVKQQTLLHHRQKQLAQLATKLKTMLGKTQEIVSASRTFSHGEEVKTLMKSLSIAMQHTINAIASGHKTLGIKDADMRRLQTAGDAFIRKAAELTAADDDLLGFDDF